MSPVIPVPAWAERQGISPTGRGPRVHDAWGSGLFGMTRDNGRQAHWGLDLLCEPGQIARSPWDMEVERQRNPYAGYAGLQARTAWGARIVLYYVTPLDGDACRPRMYRKGEPLGICQDISRRVQRRADGSTYTYAGMQPHVHLEVWLQAGCNAWMSRGGADQEIAIDPGLLLRLAT